MKCSELTTLLPLNQAVILALAIMAADHGMLFAQAESAAAETDPLQELFQTLPLLDPALVPRDGTNTFFYFAGKYIDGQGFGSPYNYGPVRDFGLPVYLLDTNSFIV